MDHDHEFPPTCFACIMNDAHGAAASIGGGGSASKKMTMPLPGIADIEGTQIDPRLSALCGGVVDAHVHVFPDRLFQAIWSWFDVHGWPIRYKIFTSQVVDFLLSRGVDHVVALLYAHKPGIARDLNEYMATLVKSSPRVTGFGTVFPGEPDAPKILAEAFVMGLSGVKLHCHVQCIAADDPRMHELYAVCAENDKPVLVHAGREPTSAGYKCDPHVLCHVDRIRAVLDAHPKLKLVVPHLGYDEVAEYGALLASHDNLWLDTTMAASGIFVSDEAPIWRLLQARPDRILFGTDFPNVPYAWDREILRLSARLTDDALAGILGQTARALYRI